MKLQPAALLVLFLASFAVAQNPPPARRPGRFQPPASTVPAAPRATDAPAIDLSGPWKGAFGDGTSVYFVDLLLESPGDHRTLTGELKYTSIVTSMMGRGVRPMEGGWKLAGSVDPGTRAFALMPDATQPLTGPRMAVDRQGLSGVLSAKRNEIAGQLAKPYAPSADGPFFVFVRAGDAADRVAAIASLRKIAEHAAAAQGAHPERGEASGPAADALVRWVARFDQEYGSAAKNGVVDQIAEKALPLLGDEAFKPVFGDTYDAIEYSPLLHSLQRLVTASTGGPGARPDPARDLGTLQYVLPPTPPRVVTIPAMRTLDAWQAEMLAHFRDDPPVASAFDDLDATLKAIHERIPYAWPSDRKRTDEAIEQLKTRVSGSGLTVNVDSAVSSAAGLAGAKTLASWAKDNAAMLQLAPPAEREAAQKKIDAKLDELLVPLLEPHEAQLAKLGTGEAALRAGEAWHQALLAQLGFAAERPPVTRTIGRLLARREGDLATGREPILKSIESIRTIEAVDALFTMELSVPGDEKLRDYPAVAAAASARKEAIRVEQILALFSEEERAIMDRPGHLDLARAKPRKPTAEEVRLAMVRAYAAGEGKMIDTRSARTIRRSDSPLLMPFPLILTFSDATELEVVPIPDTPDYACRFIMRMQMALPPDNALANYDSVVRKGTEQMIQFANAFAAAAATEAQVETLHLYDNGWGIPRLRDSVEAEAALGRFFGPR